jgi:hypothetical protein
MSLLEVQPFAWPTLQPVEEMLAGQGAVPATGAKRDDGEQLQALAQLARLLERSLPESLQDQALFLVLLVESEKCAGEQNGDVLQPCLRPLTTAGYLVEREQRERTRSDWSALPTVAMLRKQLQALIRIPYFLDSSGRLQHYRKAIEGQQEPFVALQVAFVAAMLLEGGLGQMLHFCSVLMEGVERREERIRELEHECTAANVEQVIQEQAWRGTDTCSVTTETVNDTLSDSALQPDTMSMSDQFSSTESRSRIVDGCRIKQLLRPGVSSEDGSGSLRALDASTDQEFITAIMQDMENWNPVAYERNHRDELPAVMVDPNGSLSATMLENSLPKSCLQRSSKAADGDALQGDELKGSMAPAAEAHAADASGADEMDRTASSKESMKGVQAQLTEASPAITGIVLHDEAPSIRVSGKADDGHGATLHLQDQVCALQASLDSARREHEELRSHLVEKILEIRHLSEEFQEYSQSREFLEEKEATMRKLLSTMESHCERQQDVIRMLQKSCVEAELRAQQATSLRTANEELSTQLLCMQARLVERDERIETLENELHRLRDLKASKLPDTMNVIDSSVTEQSSIRSVSLDGEATANDLVPQRSDGAEWVPCMRTTSGPEDISGKSNGCAFTVELCSTEKCQQEARLPLWLFFYLVYSTHATHHWRVMQQFRRRCDRARKQHLMALTQIVSLRQEKAKLCERLERLCWDINAGHCQRSRLEYALQQQRNELHRFKRLHQQSLWYWLRRLAPLSVVERQSAR